jgi:hypothetical protein
MPLLWQLQVFDRAGNTIGTLSKPPGGPIYMEGSPDAFALCIPDLRKLPDFFAPQISMASTPTAARSSSGAGQEMFSEGKSGGRRAEGAGRWARRA